LFASFACLAGTASFAGDTDRLDMQNIVLPAAFASDTLTTIEFHSFGQGENGAPLQPQQFPAPSPVPDYPA
jgi:hypothetical protein